jgi:hypothetical protein
MRCVQPGASVTRATAPFFAITQNNFLCVFY